MCLPLPRSFVIISIIVVFTGTVIALVIISLLHFSLDIRFALCYTACVQLFIHSFRKGKTMTRKDTPWGIADHRERIADGIDFYSTPSHGGYFLSPERNALV